jgi:formate hydrogenlyase transcriptional activator
MVAQGAFRSDLFYRLNVFPIEVPPLRDRREDIPAHVWHFVRKFSRRMDRQITSIPDVAMKALQQWDWPGNIRELENVVERAVILSSGQTLRVPLGAVQRTASPATVTSTLRQTEREAILRALRESDGVIAGARGAAARLGLKRTTLQSKMQKLGIIRPTY